MLFFYLLQAKLAPYLNGRCFFMDNQIVQELSEEFQEELGSILSYWQIHTIDHELGGFYGKIDFGNNVVPDASKGAVLNTRILWTFSAAYNLTKDNKYLETADRAYDYLLKHFVDEKHGGLVWAVDHTGKALEKRKQTYAQGFGIYAFSEYYRATGNKDSLDQAISLYKFIESNCLDELHGGYTEALSEDWSPLEDMRLSEKDENYPKSMNTHLHILEPYTNLYRVWNDDLLADRIKAIIRIFLNQIIDSKSNHFNLFFEKDWTCRSEIISYGHDIEGAWLLHEAAEVINDRELMEEVKNVALKMTDSVLNEGTDKDGSVFYERESANGHLDTDKHWWPQAEALVGLMNSYQMSDDDKYFREVLRVWDFIKDRMLDKQNGEWFWSVDVEGDPNKSEDKAGFWKCPYHNGRACIEMINRLKRLPMN